ncbi:EKC/KEOPS complex subunit CGI121/TPRKB [Aspergillus affinis]|uniref:EKC/KEOPS complex subunit CGI121/TPRKB n=1 Tax=Aspergillus affinis TaxID=1070780 RepID=UPI0022FDC528|nr:CGI-121-domain-containing protein [Aspergillus affinis]KAI9037771.1 CGI-121-domain-containing protein [Aspergillus affinis]
MSASLETISLAHLPSSLPVHVALYRDLKNAPFLRQQLISGNAEFEYAFIDASMVLSKTHALSAVFRAVNDYLNDRLKSRNVHSETVFALNPTTNIADSFRKFGITDATKDLLVIKVSVNPSFTHDTVAAHLSQYIEGSMVPFNDETLSQVADVPKIKKAYKLGALNTTPGNQANGVQDDQMKRLELSVLAAIALRGAT